MISVFWINEVMLLFLLLSLFVLILAILACALIWIQPISKVRSLLSWRKDFQQTPRCAAAEAGAADFAGDTFPFVLTLTQHSVKDIGSRAVVFQPRCKPTPWPLLFVTELADLFSSACKPCAIYTVRVHYMVPSPLVSARCVSLHGSELSCNVCVVINHHYTLTCTGETALSDASPSLLWDPKLKINKIKRINMLSASEEVVYLFCLSFKPHLIKYLYFWPLTISLNKLDQCTTSILWRYADRYQPKARAKYQ